MIRLQQNAQLSGIDNSGSNRIRDHPLKHIITKTLVKRSRESGLYAVKYIHLCENCCKTEYFAANVNESIEQSLRIGQTAAKAAQIDFIAFIICSLSNHITAF